MTPTEKWFLVGLVFLCALYALWRCTRRKRATRFAVAFGPIRPKHDGERRASIMEQTITNEQKVLLTVKPETPGGHPTRVDGPVTFAVKSGNCTLMPNDDTSVWIISGDDASDSEIGFTADADTGDGVENISDSVIVHVVLAKAARFGVGFGTPEPK